jgi:uncharacterized protein
VSFEWDPRKAAANLHDHGVSFEEASTTFEDPLQIHFADDSHSIREQRFLCLGISDQGRLLIVVYTEPRSETVRLISAREATRRERKGYETQSDLS